MTTPDFVQRIIAMYRTPNQSSNPYRPETASWSAPCPHCQADADWWAGRTTTGLQYRMHCTMCGPIEWVATP